MRIAVALVACLALLGCKEESRKIASDPSVITYSRDVRTGLCFATIGIYSVSTALHGIEHISKSNVPCTPEVMNLIPMNQR